MSFVRLIFAIACLTVVHAAWALDDDDASTEPAPVPAGATLTSGNLAGLDKLSLSPDGKFAVIAGKDGKIRIFTTADLKLTSTIDAHDGGCFDADVTASGTHIVSGGADHLVKEWDLSTGKETRRLEGHAGDVKSVALSNDGKLIASSDARGSVRIWDFSTGKQLHQLKVERHALPPDVDPNDAPVTIDSLSFSPDGRILLSEDDDERARLWNAVTGKELRVIAAHDNTVAVVALGPDGSTALTARQGGRLRLWDVGTGEMRRILAAHHRKGAQRSADVTCVTFSPDGQYFFSGGKDGTVRQFELTTATEIRCFELSSAPAGVACSPDGKTLYSISPREGVARFDLSKTPVLRGELPGVGSFPDAWQKLSAKEYADRVAAIQFYLNAERGAAVKHLAEQLEHAAKALAERETFAQLIDKLNSDNYPVRLNAYEELKRLGPAARAELWFAAQKGPAELRVRAAALLNEIGGGIDSRLVLGMELLRWLETPDARAALTRLGAIDSASAALQPYAARARTILAEISKN